MEILGIPEDVCENEEAVLKIAWVLNVDVKAEDIDICHWVKRKNSNPIIARFVSHKVKRALYKNRVQLKNVELLELFPSASVPARVASERIFINENLTAFHWRLVKKATDKKNDQLPLGVWTIDGKVFVKTSPAGNPIRICYESDLDNLWLNVNYCWWVEAQWNSYVWEGDLQKVNFYPFLCNWLCCIVFLPHYFT